MSYPMMIKLVEKLHLRTIDGDLKWEETEDDGIYQVAFPNFSVRVSGLQSRGETLDYWVTIYNADGKLIDGVSDVDLKDELLKIDLTSYAFMKELYDYARRVAMGVNDALSEILASLDNKSAQQSDPDDSQ